jgi:hypothetical protein
MKIHHIVDDLQRQVAANVGHNELLAVYNLDARSFLSVHRLVNLLIVLCQANTSTQMSVADIFKSPIWPYPFETHLDVA